MLRFKLYRDSENPGVFDSTNQIIHNIFDNRSELLSYSCNLKDQESAYVFDTFEKGTYPLCLGENNECQLSIKLD